MIYDTDSEVGEQDSNFTEFINQLTTEGLKGHQFVHGEMDILATRSI